MCVRVCLCVGIYIGLKIDMVNNNTCINHKTHCFLLSLMVSILTKKPKQHIKMVELHHDLDFFFMFTISVCREVNERNNVTHCGL